MDFNHIIKKRFKSILLYFLISEKDFFFFFFVNDPPSNAANTKYNNKLLIFRRTIGPLFLFISIKIQRFLVYD